MEVVRSWGGATRQYGRVRHSPPIFQASGDRTDPSSCPLPETLETPANDNSRKTNQPASFVSGSPFHPHLRKDVKKLRIYLDTSVIGGCYDEEFAHASLRLFRAVRNGRAIVLVSPITTEEPEDAPEQVRRVLDELPADMQEGLSLSKEITDLAQAYLAERVVPANFADDALHIAFATVYGADVLVSWNFRHIVNLSRIHQFNAVNLVQGYRPLEIRSPLELFGDEKDDEGNHAEEEKDI